MTKLKYAGTCEFCGKIQYPTRKDAKEARRLMKGKGLSQSGVGVYQCGDYWHLGHLSASVRAGRLSREERYLGAEIAPEDGGTAPIRAKGNPIPQESRDLVFARDGYRCVRCGGAASDWHHRRKRSVADEHQHCACVGIATCRKCHSYIHAHPTESTEKGWIVTQWEKEPWKMPVKTPKGMVVTTCDGRALSTTATSRLDLLERNSAKATTTSAGEGSRSPH